MLLRHSNQRRNQSNPSALWTRRISPNRKPGEYFIDVILCRLKVRKLRQWRQFSDPKSTNRFQLLRWQSYDLLNVISSNKNFDINIDFVVYVNPWNDSLIRRRTAFQIKMIIVRHGINQKIIVCVGRVKSFKRNAGWRIRFARFFFEPSNRFSFK